MLHSEVAHLDERVQRLIAAFRQERLERKRAIQERDRLLALNGTPVETVEQVRALVGSKPRSMALLIDRGGQRLFVPVEPG